MRLLEKMSARKSSPPTPPVRSAIVALATVNERELNVEAPPPLLHAGHQIAKAKPSLPARASRPAVTPEISARTTPAPWNRKKF